MKFPAATICYQFRRFVILQDVKNVLADKNKGQLLTFLGDKMKTLIPGQDKTSR